MRSSSGVGVCLGMAVLALPLAACSNRPPNPAELVPADIIVNTVKCEIAQLVTDFDVQKGRRTVLLDQDFVVNLKLKAAEATSASVNAGGALKIISMNGISPTLDVGASVARSHTVDTTTDFTVSGRVKNANICEQARDSRRMLVGGIGYYTFMHQLASDLNNFIAGDPKIIADTFKYDRTFGVTETFTGAAGYEAVSLSGSKQFDYVQQITITVKNRKIATQTKVGGGRIEGAKPAATRDQAQFYGPMSCGVARCLPRGVQPLGPDSETASPDR